MGSWGEGKVGVVWNWVHNAPSPELEKIYVDYKKKYNEDFIFAAHWNTMNMLHEAMRKAKSTDAKKVAFALEGMAYKSPMGEVRMRKSDHQLEAPLYLGMGQTRLQRREIRRRKHRLRLPLRSGVGLLRQRPTHLVPDETPRLSPRTTNVRRHKKTIHVKSMDGFLFQQTP